MATEFPSNLYWCVDEFSNMLIVDRLRGRCALTQRYRTYLDKEQREQPLPRYETLRDIALAILERCQDDADQFVHEYGKSTESGQYYFPGRLFGGGENAAPSSFLGIVGSTPANY